MKRGAEWPARVVLLATVFSLVSIGLACVETPHATKRKATRYDMEAARVALVGYYERYRRFPDGPWSSIAQMLVSQRLLKAVLIQDAWNHPYSYETVNGGNGQAGFRLRSCGSDGICTGGKDKSVPGARDDYATDLVISDLGWE